MNDKADAELVERALDALRAIEDRLEELAPGIAAEDDVYPGGEEGMAGLALLHHIMRLGCGMEDAAQHLEEHCREIGRLQSDYRKAREEPLRLTLEEIELAACNHFPPPQVAMHTLNYAIARWKEGGDRWLGENGGMELASRREVQKQATKRQRHDLAAGFFTLRQQRSGQYPLTDAGRRDAAEALGCTENQLRDALREVSPHLKQAWLSGFPAPPLKK